MSDIQPFEPKAEAPLAQVEVASSRAAQEVQGQIVMAKKFPRDLVTAQTRILTACKRMGLAEVAFYSYQKGGTQILGPSIRLAEALAQGWGNMDFGIIELEQRKGESSVMAYAWDLETNTRETKIFTVPHAIKSHNQIKTLTDPRDIYEHVANMGARRLRACILGIIPGDIQQGAIEECKKTLAGDGTEPLIDRVRKMVVAFETFGITPEMIAERFGHNIEATDETELISLRGIYVSLRDGASKRADWFKVGDDDADGPPSDDPKDLAAGKKKAKKKVRKKEAKPPADEKLLLVDSDGTQVNVNYAKAIQLAKVKLDECGFAAVNINANILLDYVAALHEIDLTHDVVQLEWDTVIQSIKQLAQSNIEEALQPTDD